MTFQERIDRARRTNEQRDRDEIAAGLQTPAQAGASVLFATAMDAIKAGIAREDFNAVAEGYLMLQQFRDRFEVIRTQSKEKTSDKMILRPAE